MQDQLPAVVDVGMMKLVTFENYSNSHHTNNETYNTPDQTRVSLSYILSLLEENFVGKNNTDH